MNRMTTSIAIMQPTFLPWIGYFALIDRVDKFVFLDNVQFDRRSWQQRNQIKTPNGPQWLVVPVQSKGMRNQKIEDVIIQYEGSDPLEKIIRSIEHNYKKTPYYKDFSQDLFAVFSRKPEKLSDLNKSIISFFCKSFGIAEKFTDASSLPAEGKKAGLLADICEKCNANEYVSPPGSKDYLDESESFEEKKIPVIYHTYTHPTYRQSYGEFVPYMCAADLLFNEGQDSLRIIREGVMR